MFKRLTPEQHHEDTVASILGTVPTVKLTAAWLVLVWEALIPRLWPIFGVVGLFVAIGLANILPLLGPWLHAAALLGFAAALAWAVVRACRGIGWPGSWRAARRLEADGELRHRPLSDPDPTLPEGAAFDPLAQALWAREIGRRSEDRKRTPTPLPKPVLAAVDPRGLRLMLLLALGIAFVQAGDDWRRHLLVAMDPALAFGGPATPAILDLYITPPDYTGRAPLYLQATLGEAEEGDRRTLPVPTGSTVIARLSRTQSNTSPDLRIGPRRLPFTEAEGGGWEAEATIISGNLIGVEQSNRLLVDWPLALLEDQLPTIGFDRDPSASPSQTVGFDWSAEDDYGVVDIRLTIRLDASAPEALAGDPLEVEVHGGPVRSGQVRGSEYVDLTPHPWAGQPVILRLAAADAIGQVGQSRGITMILPERRFIDPIAQAIADQRKQLLIDPAMATSVAESLSTLAVRPDRYGDDLVVFLALRMTARRLMLVTSPVNPGAPSDIVSSVADILWDTALRIEDGDLSLAEQRLRDARDALSQALADGAGQEEIEARLNAVREALDDYMRAWQEAALEAMMEEGLEAMPELPSGLLEQMMTPDQLQSMLDDIGEMAETGANDAARQMLDQLDRMLESLTNPMVASPQQQGQMQQAMEMIRDLEALMQAQQALQDQTFRNSQEPTQQGETGDGEPGDPSSSGEADAVTQEALRRALGDLMRQMAEVTGGIPDPFGEAEGAMRRSEEALSQGLPGDALDPQGEALDRLAEGLEGLVNDMMEGMAGQPGMMPGQAGPGQSGQGVPPQFGQGPNQDPLGRNSPNGTGVDDRDIDLPSERAVRRAREIIDELRRRAGDRTRPEVELDYIDRLLDRF